jgi:hypothetical protein
MIKDLENQDILEIFRPEFNYFLQEDVSDIESTKNFLLTLSKEDKKSFINDPLLSKIYLKNYGNIRLAKAYANVMYSFCESLRVRPSRCIMNTLLFPFIFNNKSLLENLNVRKDVVNNLKILSLLPLTTNYINGPKNGEESPFLIHTYVCLKITINPYVSFSYDDDMNLLATNLINDF